MKITIVGGGNIGTQFAVICAEKGFDVTLFTSKPENFDSELTIVDEHGAVSHTGRIALATNNPKLAFSNADLIFITLPAFCMTNIANIIKLYAHSNQYIGIIPGIGGGECAFRQCLDKGATVFGIQRVPSVARLVNYGKCVRATGYRQELFLGALPGNNADYCCRIMSKMFEMPCYDVGNYLNITLTPSNPILHTTRLYTVFHDYGEGVIYKHIPLFYEEWDDNSSELLLLCDEEVQLLCNRLHHIENRLEFPFVRSLKQHYESNTPLELTKKIRSIQSLRGLHTPAIEVNGGWIPDLSSRYFTADFPFGLEIIKQIADMAYLNVPNINRTLKWYYHITKNHNNFNYSHYHINKYQDLFAFYLR